jgi:hypothetical protein
MAAFLALWPHAAAAQAAPGDSVPAERLEALPFAKNSLPLPALGFGAGIAIPTQGLGGVERAFEKIENVYRAQGYSLPSPHLSLDAMATYRMTVRPGKNYEIVGQLCRTRGSESGTESELNTTGLLIARRFASTETGASSLVVGLGGGAYGFLFRREYNVPVSPTNADGSYYLLRNITLEGGGAYGTGAAGFTLRAGRHVAFDGLAQYLWMKDTAKSVPPAGEVSFHLSGLVLSGTLSFFY